jgi:hypothetical protein
MVDAATFQDDDFAALFAESIAQENAKEGEILRGTVISVGKDLATGRRLVESRENDDGLSSSRRRRPTRSRSGTRSAPRASATSSSRAPSPRA